MRKWKPSKTAAKEFAQKMGEIENFCKEHNIHASRNSDSYYFAINGKKYRVSNHSIEASNSAAFDTITGQRKREFYHEGGRKDDVIYIHASKTRLVEIYNDLAAGYELDGRGNRK